MPTISMVHGQVMILRPITAKATCLIFHSLWPERCLGYAAVHTHQFVSHSPYQFDGCSYTFVMKKSIFHSGYLITEVIFKQLLINIAI